MTRRHLVIAAAWLLHTASWLLPAVKGLLGSRLDHGIPGWQVFLAQTCALRPCEGTSADPWYGTAISVIGVVTTVLFVLVSPWIVWRASRKTSPCGCIGHGWCLCCELTVVRFLRT
jgi:hypothetical protein